ncbi:MAG: TRAM domain-containing protein [Armatimonadetes bacterium]|nr:TRAM domain-containing protein [Armatimonadota bacterium]
MSIRSFKQLFTVIFALILAVIGIVMGAGLPRLPSIASFPSGEELMRSYPGYMYYTISALALVGILLGVILGPLFAGELVAMGNTLEHISARDKIAVALGAIAGLLVDTPFFLFLYRTPIGFAIAILLGVALVYLGIRATWSMKEEIRFMFTPPTIPSTDSNMDMTHCKILDTNVIIDGRIADICRSGFVEGPIYVPGFVLDELQHIADSADALKRTRGRRGLDILNAMQKELPLVVRQHDGRLPATQFEEVDSRLVMLAKKLNGAIITNDFNLNKVAVLQGVRVLNVNELANALKPVVLPGEELPVLIVKEGKEPNQGLAYLDDGTMIVVEDGRKAIGENRVVTVTSVLQTVAGKMIFARLKNGEDEEEPIDRSYRIDAGSRTRRKVR